MDGTTVLLSHGLRAAGACAFEAELRGLTGREEALIGDCPARMTPAECATELLATVTRRIGALEPVTREMAADLVVGDREQLLLALCHMTFGANLDLVATCQNEACGAVCEVPVQIADIIGERPTVACEVEYEIRPIVPEGAWRVRFRLPSGRDQERAAQLADPAAATRLLISGCVGEITNPAGNLVSAADLPAALEPLLSEAFQRLDPAAESTTEIICPSCGALNQAILDGFTILHAGLTRSSGIFGDVYRMARLYHWSEAEILALPRTRRKRYLEVAAEMEATA